MTSIKTQVQSKIDKAGSTPKSAKEQNHMNEFMFWKSLQTNQDYPNDFNQNSSSI